MHKKIAKYYDERKINIGTYLAKDIEKKNYYALRYVRYAINNLAQVQGMHCLLSELAQFKDDSAIPNERYREYHNKIMELHCAYFVAKQLGLSITKVESHRTKVKSPYRVGEKSCDIRASNETDDYYFEAKDCSVELVTQYEKDGLVHVKPMDEEKVYMWITGKCEEAIEKGANYLCCRTPMWVDYRPRKYYRWVKEVFPDIRTIAPQEYQISLPLNDIPAFFKGFYIIKAWGFMKFHVT